MKIKIIATIGPASDSPKILKQMVKAGMNIARFNTKFGTRKKYSEAIKYLSGQAKIMFDIKSDKYISWLQKNKKFDYLAISFTESSSQINKYREIFGSRIKLIAKIESRKGLKNINEIIRSADGIMVARGDLGDHIHFEDVPIFQKIIIKKCNAHKKFVITATEMLLSMVENKKPERAEVSDVANAVLDGSDAVMLSEETAIGKNPVLVVKTMAHIIKETQKNKKIL